MSTTVHCVVLGREAPALATPPWPGALGQRIVDNVSQDGWQLWLQRQTMLMNEKRLSPINPEHRAYLEQQMEIFLFGEGGDEPQGWLPPVSG